MNKKIIGILVIMLLLISSLSVTGIFKKNNDGAKKDDYKNPTWTIYSTDNTEYRNLEKSKSLSDHIKSIEVEIVKPEQGYIYLNGRELFPLFFITLIIGPFTFEVNVSGDNPINKVEFYIEITY